MRLLEGKKTAEHVKAQVLNQVELLKGHGVTPGLKVVLVGSNPASLSYVGMVTRSAQKYGIDAEVITLAEEASEDELLDCIESLNHDEQTHGILVQLPLPKHMSEQKVIERLNPDKDIDGFHPINAGKLSQGQDCLVPCTPYGVYKMLEVEAIDIKGMEVVILGRSNIVGKPAAQLMLQKHATVTICHSRTKDLESVTRRADLLIAALGQKRFVKGDMIKEGAIVIDVGIHNEDGKIVGDVDFESVKDKVSMITPVPGGVGTTTIAMLMYNTAKTCAKQVGIEGVI